jgi:hypothetical protein
MLKLIVAFAALVVGMPCAAQDLSLDGWLRADAGRNAFTYLHPSRTAVVWVTQLARDADLRRIVDTVRQRALSKCPGLRDVRAVPILAGRAAQFRLVQGGQLCSVASAASATAQAVVFSVEPLNAGLRAEARSLALLLATVTPAGASVSAASLPASAPPVRSGGGATVGAGDGTADVAMLAAIRSVPTANRPRYLFDRFVMRMLGSQLQRVGEVWMAFDNGVATDCADWNPATTAPTPATLAQYTECRVARWVARRDGTYQVTSLDGRETEDVVFGLWRPFEAAERLGIDFDSWDARGGPVAGVMPYADITSVELVLHSDGRFGSTSQNRNWTLGDRTERNASRSGRYYLDGYLMAVQGPDGAVSLHFAGYQRIDGRLRLIAFHGRTFTPK